MLKDKDGMANIFFIAIALCLGCSAAVSLATVGLKPYQSKAVELFRKQSILDAAGLYAEGLDVEAIYNANIYEIAIDLKTGQQIPISRLPDGEKYDQDRAYDLKDQRNEFASGEFGPDVAKIKYFPKYAWVYVVKKSESSDEPEMLIFPVQGRGLWSILKGFVATDPKVEVVRGITFYDHAETPGLGGEVDNPKWKDQWRKGLTIYKNAENFEMAVKVAKTTAAPPVNGKYVEVDGLSGATITSNGVTNTLHFWFGGGGYGEFIKRVKAGEKISRDVLN
jgi:Na+-transporting NADH:ubiquinone oxidoreductase subunit C